MGTAEDRLEIIDLIARYSHAVDGSDPVAVVDLFTDAAAIYARLADSERVMEGRAEILAMAKGVTTRPSGVQSRHFQTGTTFVELTSERALTRTYLLAVRNELGKGATPTTTGIYEDEVVRTPLGWRFKLRRFVADPPPPPKA